MNDITALMATMKAAAEKATPGIWEMEQENIWFFQDGYTKHLMYVTQGDDVDDHQGHINTQYIAEVSPANVLALVEALEKAQAITAAAEKLVRCKGRYHSEQNYRALAALFGVNTPDLPPLESESRTVTVKLRDINEYLAEVHDKTLNLAFRRLAEGVRQGDVVAMLAAGIQVIEGEA
ncbi:hypothetical protein EB837_20565 [Kluyvera ascorbata]|uniref:Ead/Ea22-like family protein n=1 Tax=Kluyvera ascorbata TaxID=51288 RepID=A0A3N2RTL9_9ENTR|nr:ead/Ea22-like family protein [Kluyvera ascorbata]ROU10786.1 hypothetical protein EB837_20565 [Kluyvera ascorbata]